MTNDTLKTARLSLRLSQEEFARRIRDAGEAVGEPNDASKRARPALGVRYHGPTPAGLRTRA